MPTPHNSERRPLIRSIRDGEFAEALTIINSAAEAYRGVIPNDCWHEPYMSSSELEAEIAAGVRFSGGDVDGRLAGVMGIQRVRNVELIRHAYVLPAHQGKGVGSKLLSHLRAQADRQILVGTWAAATWAIHFYERHEFRLVPKTLQALLLKAYWTVSDRQIETSVVLAAPELSSAAAAALIEQANSPPYC